MLLNRLKPGGSFFRNSILMPYLMPSSAMLLIWLVLFDYGGVINRLVTSLGLMRVSWLEGAALRVPVILMYRVEKTSALPWSSFWRRCNPSPSPCMNMPVLEGAGFFRQAFSITLPMVVPSAFLVFVLSWINAFKIFKEVYFIGGAYPDEAVYTLQNYMNNMFGKLNYQNVTTAAYSFAIIVFIIFGALFFMQKRCRTGSIRRARCGHCEKNILLSRVLLTLVALVILLPVLLTALYSFFSPEEIKAFMETRGNYDASAWMEIKLAPRVFSLSQYYNILIEDVSVLRLLCNSAMYTVAILLGQALVSPPWPTP